MGDILKYREVMKGHENEGIKLLDINSLPASEEKLLKAEAFSNRIYQQKAVNQLLLKHALSNLYEFMGDMTRAIDYRKEALELEKLKSGLNSCQVLEHLAKLTVLYNKKGAKQGVDKIELNHYLAETRALFFNIHGMDFKLTSSEQIPVYELLSHAFLKQ
jgi:hypothetical protein